MRIQEMRSGLFHLRKRLDVRQQINHALAAQTAKEAIIESLSEFIASDMPKAITSDIDNPMWSVVSFDQCEASGLTYKQAAKLMQELEERGVAGLCIVTDNAASHLKT